MIKRLLLIILIFSCTHFYLDAICIYDATRGKWVDEDTGLDCPNTIPTAAPFLTITPDARGGALGDASVALSADANAMHRNVARLAFAEGKTQISGTYTPWLSDLGLDDIYMAYLSGYTKLDDNQALGFAFRYFSLGSIDYTNNQGTLLTNDNPNEFEIAVGYSRKLSEKLSLGATGKFVYSDLANGQNVNGFAIKAGTAVAVDLGLFYKTSLNNVNQDDLAIGFSMTNLGSRMSYTEQDENSEYLPANLSLGAAYTMHLDDFNDLTFTLEFNKLLVPTPQFDDQRTPGINEADEDNNGIPDFKEKDFFSSVFGSFGDAPNGFSEELKEINISAGVEYWYNQLFAIRAGYFYENPDKGNRQYITTGLGLKYNLLTINMSYLISTQSSGLQATNPLDKTLRFSIMVNLGEGEVL